MRTRFTIDPESGLLMDRNGQTLGRVVSITIDDSPLATTERLGYGERCSCCSKSLHSPSEGSQKENPIPQRQTPSQLEREAVHRVWDYWLKTSAKNQKLDAKRERIIRNAIRLVGEEPTKRALLGLTRSPHHQGQNEQRKQYMEVRYALKGIGDESDDERIEKAISWAAIHAPDGKRLPAAKAERLLEEVRYTLSLPHRPERERGEKAWKALREAGYTIVALDKAPWARLA